jgi:hypothetical protein
MKRRATLAGLLTLCSTLLLPALPAHADEPGLVRQRAGDGRPFTIAVVPDTQREVHYDSDKRLVNRLRWLVNRADPLDLRYVVQVGDVTDWGWVDQPQLTRASNAFQRLEDASIPYSIAVGNHDTRAVGWNGHGGYGGSAYSENPECAQRYSPSECRVTVLVRHTEEINARFPASRFADMRDEWEPGKIDNASSTFRAGGLDWLVLDLELWPRPEAVAWAAQVVRNHPTYNVIVNTHSYLTARGTIYNKADYGSTSPRYVWQNLVRRYPNIVMVTCGHIGAARVRTDRGDNGNKVVSLLQNFGKVDDTNPVRLVTVDPARGTLTTRVYAPLTDRNFRTYSATIKGMKFVKP